MFSVPPLVGLTSFLSYFSVPCSATGNIIAASESVIARLPASKRRRIHVDAAFKACIPLWLSGGIIGSPRGRPGFGSRSDGIYIYAANALLCKSPEGDCRDAFCSQRARSTRLPATEHRFYGSRASLAKENGVFSAPLNLGDFHSSHILAFCRRSENANHSVCSPRGNCRRVFCCPRARGTGLQANASVDNTRVDFVYVSSLWSSGRFLDLRAGDRRFESQAGRQKIFMPPNANHSVCSPRGNYRRVFAAHEHGR